VKDSVFELVDGAQFVSRCDGVESLFGFGIDMSAKDVAEEDYVVTSGGLGLEGTFEISDGIGEED